MKVCSFFKLCFLLNKLINSDGINKTNNVLIELRIINFVYFSLTSQGIGSLNKNSDE